MSDTENGAKSAKTKAKTKAAGEGWTAASDGASVSKTFKLGSAADAVKLAKRALQMAEKGKVAVNIGLAGSQLIISVGAANGKLAEAERRVTRRLDSATGDKAARAKAKPAAEG